MACGEWGTWGRTSTPTQVFHTFPTVSRNFGSLSIRLAATLIALMMVEWSRLNWRPISEAVARVSFQHSHTAI